MKKISDWAFSKGLKRNESFISQLKKRGKYDLVEWLHSVGINGYLSLEEEVEKRLKHLYRTSSRNGNNFKKEFGEDDGDRICTIARNLVKKGSRLNTETVKELAEHWKIEVRDDKERA